MSVSPSVLLPIQESAAIHLPLTRELSPKVTEGETPLNKNFGYRTDLLKKYLKIFEKYQKNYCKTEKNVL